MAKLPDSDSEVAALYELPLVEFTAARNALAKKLGPAGLDVRTREKPQAAAWAVNQLYWHRRSTYDALVRAALAMRTAHTHMLSGRRADVPQAEGVHNDAVRAATAAIRDLALSAGESLSGATMDAVLETLRALPSNDPPGQLTRPLKPMGMEALIGIGVRESRSPGVEHRAGVRASRGPEVEHRAGVQASRGPGVEHRAGVRASRGPGVEHRAGVRASRGPGVGKAAAAERVAAKKEAVERAKKRKELERKLRDAEGVEREAESALAEARKAVAKVERDYAAVRDRLQFLEKQRSDVEQEAHKRARELQEAANARTQAAQDLDGL